MRKIIVLFLFFIILYGDFKVLKVEFNGNKAFSTKFLLEWINTKVNAEYNEYTLRHDEFKLLQLYRDNGFFDVNIEKYIKVNIKLKGVSIKFVINENLHYPIKKIEFIGCKSIIKDSLDKFLKIKVGMPYDALRATLSTYGMIDYYSTKGFSYATIKDTFLMLKGTGVIVKYYIEEGDEVFIKKFEYENKTQIIESVIKKYIDLKEGEIYNPEKITSIKRKLLNTYLFGRVDVSTEGLIEQKDSVSIKFVLHPAQLLDINLGGGFMSPEWIIGRISIIRKGLFGGEHRLKIDAEPGLSIKGGRKTNLSLAFTSKDILWTPFDLTFKYKFEELKKKFYENVNRIEAQLGYTHSENKGGYFSYQWIYTRDTTNVFKLDQVQAIYAEIDLRDNSFDPKKGIRLITDLKYGGAIRSGGSFKSYNIRFATAMGFGKFVFEGYGATGKVYYKELPKYIYLFYNDGVNTLRTLGNYSFGDIYDNYTERYYYDRFLSYNLQLKYRIITGLYAIIFTDGLYIDNLNNSKGFGINYVSPVGSVRLEIGFGKDRNGNNKFDYIIAIGGII